MSVPGRILSSLGLVLVLALAGCSGGGGDGTPDDGPSADDLGLQATASTGLIRGVVVDDAIRPLANVTVTLQGETPVSKKTGAEGAFGFDGLTPGTYFLKAVKLGYFETQQSVEVVAGVTDPAAVKIQLAFNAGYQPYVESKVFEGFIECTTSALVLCGAPNTLEPLSCEFFQVCYGNLTNDRFTFTLLFGPNVTMVQSEMVWSSTQAASPELFLSQEALTADCPNTDLSTLLNGTAGASPIYTRLDETVLDKYEIGPTCGVYYSVFSGDTQGTPLGVTVEQRFTMYVHAFYGYLPPADWRFTTDETVPQPPQ
ncbi:MAG: carboxypeptidase-like regulatory domain-containing protein [Candidatus Thermoplasmatota archaeon]|jgi:hypothetical protein